MEALHTEESLRETEIFDIVKVIVCFSIFFHGFTAPFIHLHLKGRMPAAVEIEREEESEGGMDSEYTSDIDGEDFDVLMAK